MEWLDRWIPALVMALIALGNIYRTYRHYRNQDQDLKDAIRGLEDQFKRLEFRLNSHSDQAKAAKEDSKTNHEKLERLQREVRRVARRNGDRTDEPTSGGGGVAL